MSRLQGYCSVCFTPCPASKGVPGFLITKAVNDTVAGASGPKCSDQLIIPGGNNGGRTRESVFCGAALNVEDGLESDTQICSKYCTFIFNRVHGAIPDVADLFLKWTMILRNGLLVVISISSIAIALNLIGLVLSVAYASLYVF